MPPKPVECTDFSVTLEAMGGRLDSVESSIAALATFVRDSLALSQQRHDDQDMKHQLLLTELECISSKLSSSVSSPNVNVAGGSSSLPPPSERVPEHQPRGTAYDPIRESFDEFCLFVKKVELPGFTGVDPVGWISRVETYFEVHNTSDEMKIRLARLCMEGSTIHWFNLSEEHLTWNSFKRVLLLRFAGSVYPI